MVSICITDNICVTSRSACGGMYFKLDCSIDREAVPIASPLPNITWFRNGQRAVYYTNGFEQIRDTDFFIQFPILKVGVFNINPISGWRNGALLLDNIFPDIRSSMLGNLSSDITLDIVRAQVFNIFIANWTCVRSNSLGSDVISYSVKDCHCGKLKLIMILHC